MKIEVVTNKQAMRRVRSLRMRQQLARLAGKRATVLRLGSFNDHRPPSGEHSRGRDGLWRGTHRVADKGARRRVNARARRRAMLAQRVAYVNHVEVD